MAVLINLDQVKAITAKESQPGSRMLFSDGSESKRASQPQDNGGPGKPALIKSAGVVRHRNMQTTLLPMRSSTAAFISSG